MTELFKKYEQELLTDWIKEQLAVIPLHENLLTEFEVKQDTTDFYNAFQLAIQGGELVDIKGAHWEKTLQLLDNITKSRTRLGFTPTETATFIFSLKQPLFTLIQKEFGRDVNTPGKELWAATVLLDKLGLYTAESYIKTKEEIIRRQQNEMLELSTPVVKVWDKILALPLIGTLDSIRTQVVMETLLQEIVRTESSVAIIDITGVPTVDTLVAQHLMKTVSAARLMGAECIISGIRPQIAQSMVHLGVTFSDITTRATLADAIRHAFAQTGVKVSRASRQV
ncbi:STAS domain-containing protein [Desulforhopalus vacuolatus]|nr:STAS domain-containing protein [Desulforhopalus vacuolatus]MBM9518522.1 STAS domain-containing protein [Desulforhopalus vacuolatus]